jgi:hypothetical protein
MWSFPFPIQYPNDTHIAHLDSFILDPCPAILTIPRVVYEQPSSSLFNVPDSSVSSFCPNIFLTSMPTWPKCFKSQSTAIKITYECQLHKLSNLNCTKITCRNKFTILWRLPRRHCLRHWRDLMSFLSLMFLFLLLFLMFLLTMTRPEENSKIFIITQKNTTNITKLKTQPMETIVEVLTYVCVSRLIYPWRQSFWDNVCHFPNITSSFTLFTRSIQTSLLYMSNSINEVRN